MFENLIESKQKSQRTVGQTALSLLLHGLIIFLAAKESCETSYANRSGKYQGQRGITVPQM